MGWIGCNAHHRLSRTLPRLDCAVLPTNATRRLPDFKMTSTSSLSAATVERNALRADWLRQRKTGDGITLEMALQRRRTDSRTLLSRWPLGETAKLAWVRRVMSHCQERNSLRSVVSTEGVPDGRDGMERSIAVVFNLESTMPARGRDTSAFPRRIRSEIKEDRGRDGCASRPPHRSVLEGLPQYGLLR